MAEIPPIRISSGGDLGKYFGMAEKHLNAFAALGLQLYQQGRVKEAETIFQGMLALDHQCPYGDAGLGAVALAKEPPELEAARAHLERAAALLPEDPAVHANLGETFLRLGLFDEAASEFQKCLAFDPDRENAGANRARAIISGFDLIVAEVRRIEAGGK
jgi:tetratricopeptide (TPR) repeat protein